MSQTLRVRHAEHATALSFEDVRSSFERHVGTLEEPGWPAVSAAARDEEDFRSRIEDRLGPSGFTRFLTVDHGEWLKLYGIRAKAVMYTIGNPLIAISLLRHDLRAGLNVPLRVMIYRDDASGTTRLVYDVPSTLMGGIGDPDLLSAAHALDAKLAALAEQVTGASA